MRHSHSADRLVPSMTAAATTTTKTAATAAAAAVTMSSWIVPKMATKMALWLVQAVVLKTQTTATPMRPLRTRAACEEQWVRRMGEALLAVARRLHRRVMDWKLKTLRPCLLQRMEGNEGEGEGRVMKRSLREGGQDKPEEAEEGRVEGSPKAGGSNGGTERSQRSSSTVTLEVGGGSRGGERSTGDSVGGVPPPRD